MKSVSLILSFIFPWVAPCPDNKHWGDRAAPACELRVLPNKLGDDGHTTQLPQGVPEAPGMDAVDC